MWFVLELFGGLTKKALFLGAGEANSFGISSMHEGFVGGDFIVLHQFRETGIERHHAVPTPDLHHADQVLHAAPSDA